MGWYSSERTHVILRIKGEEDYLARVEHLSLLRYDPEIGKLLFQLASGKELECHMEATNFHRAVPVGDMSSVELTEILQPIVKEQVIAALRKRLIDCLGDKKFCKSLTAI